MKRRLMAFLLAGALVASNVTPAFAADVAEDYDVVVYEDETAPDEEDAGAAEDLAGDAGEEIIDAAEDGAEDLEAPADDAGYEEDTSFDEPEDAAPVEEGEEEDEEIAGEEEELPAADEGEAELLPEEEEEAPALVGEEDEDGNIWFEEHDIDVFTDQPELPEARLYTGDLNENWKENRSLELRVGCWDDYKEDWIDSGALTAGNDYTLTEDGDCIAVTLTRDYLDAFHAEADTHRDVRLVACVYKAGHTEDDPLRETDAWFHIERARAEYDFEGDRIMLPGWDGTIDGSRDGWMIGAEHPDGEDFSYRVTNVEISKDEPIDADKGSVIADFHRDEDGEDDYWWYYRVQNYGRAVFAITYEDLAGEEQTYDMIISANPDTYDVYMDSEGGERNALPGTEIPLYTEAHHSYIDENGDYHDDTEGIGFRWIFERGDEYADIIVNPDDPSRAVLSIKELPEGRDYIDKEIRVGVRILDSNGDETEGYSATSFWIKSEYMELWPILVDHFMNVGEEVEIQPEIRRYPGRDGAEYDVISGGDSLKWEWSYDKNCVEVLDAKGNVVGNEIESASCYGDDASFTLRRLGEWHSDVHLHAHWNNPEDGDDIDLDQDYSLFGRNYDIWFEGDDRGELYSDEEAFKFSVNTDMLNVYDEGALTWKVTVGLWDGRKNEFAETLAEGDGWSFDSKTFTVTLNGKALYENGYDNVEVRVEAFRNGTLVTDEQRGFGVREARIDDILWDEVMFVDDGRWVNKDDGNQRVNVENSLFPGGWWRYKVSGVEIKQTSEEDPYDPRTAVIVESEDADGWLLRAVHGGAVEVTLTGEIFSDEGDIRQPFTQTTEFYVDDFRSHIDLHTDTGVDDFLPGKTITLIPSYDGEHYSWEDGSRWPADTTNWTVAYEAECTWMDDGFIEQYGKEDDELNAEGKYWSKKVLADGSLEVTAKAGAPNMDIEVHATLLDEKGNFLSDTWHGVYVTQDFFAAEVEGWDPSMPVGHIVELNPRLIRYDASTGEGVDVTDECNATFYFNWYEGNGNDDDPAHVIITDADGKRLQSDGEGHATGRPPFTVQRNVSWDGNVNLEAWWNVDTEDENWRNLQLPLVRSEHRARYIPSVQRGESEDQTWYYVTEDGDAVTAEPIRIVPDTSEIDALKQKGYDVKLDAEIGIGAWNNEEGHWEIHQLQGFEFTPAEWSADNGLTLSEDRVIALREALDDQGDLGWRDGIDLTVFATLNGRELCRYGMHVAIRRNIFRLEDDDVTTLPGDSFYYMDGKAALYVSDPEHSDGAEEIVTITKIESSHEEILKPRQSDSNWYIDALKPGEALICYTFTRADGTSDTHLTMLFVSDEVYRLVSEDEAGRERDYYRRIPGETGLVKPVVIHAYEENGEIKEERITPDTAGYNLVFNYDEYRDDIIETDKRSAKFTALKTGHTDLRLTATLRNAKGELLLDDEYHYHVAVVSHIASLDIDDSKTLYLAPGEALSMKDLTAFIPKTLSLRSMRTEGSPVDVTGTFFDYVGPALILSGDGDNAKVTVAQGALEGKVAEDGSFTTEIAIGAEDKDGNAGFDTLKVVIHPVAAMMAALKADAGLAEKDAVSAVRAAFDKLDPAVQKAFKDSPAYANFDAAEKSVKAAEEKAAKEGAAAKAAGAAADKAAAAANAAKANPTDATLKAAEDALAAAKAAIAEAKKQGADVSQAEKKLSAATAALGQAKTAKQANDAKKQAEEAKKQAAAAFKLNVKKNATVPIQKGKTNTKIVATLGAGDSIATVVSSKKDVTAKKKGNKIALSSKKKGAKATITVTTAYGATWSFKVKVQAGAVKTKKVSAKKTVTMKVGDKLNLYDDLNLAITPVTTSDKLKITSSAKKIASATKAGVLTAKKKGTAKITVKSGTKKKAVITVKVQ